MSFSLLPFPINAKTYKVQAGYTANKSQKENESKTTHNKRPCRYIQAFRTCGDDLSWFTISITENKDRKSQK